MEQRSNDAVLKNVQTMLRKEVCAKGTGHIVLTTMNLLRLDQNLRRLPLDRHPISVRLDLLEEKDK